MSTGTLIMKHIQTVNQREICGKDIVFCLTSHLLRRIFGPKMEEVAGQWRRLRSEELHNLYASRNIIRVNISSRVRLAGHVECMGR
jgi:hypothetical protein